MRFFFLLLSFTVTSSATDCCVFYIYLNTFHVTNEWLYIVSVQYTRVKGAWTSILHCKKKQKQRKQYTFTKRSSEWWQSETSTIMVDYNCRLKFLAVPLVCMYACKKSTKTTASNLMWDLSTVKSLHYMPTQFPSYHFGRALLLVETKFFPTINVRMFQLFDCVLLLKYKQLLRLRMF